MSRTIEIIAKTEEEAKGLANGELNDNEMIVATETLSAPTRGIFGFVGKQEYKIRFTIGEKPVARVERPVERFVEKRSVVDAPVNSSFEEEAPAERNDYPADDRPPRRSSRPPRRQNNRGRPPRREFNDNAPEDATDADVVFPERPRDPVSEVIKGHSSYQEIFSLIRDVASNVGIEQLDLHDFMRDGAWVIEASGENVSQLIGKRGRNLDSLQYLMNIILNKGSDDRIKLVLDAQGYREKRYRNLILLAQRMCKKAIASRRQVELEPMSTLDRRTIHMALKDRTDIETFSKGAEPMRRVVISPMKKKKGAPNAEWQPVADDSDSDFSEKLENSSAVPMFLEEDV
ncbi:MAG TPA: RNA-binding cell elongation regulator Jag/EloR [Candidatus Rifleibacterium sp.]|nr:RNA-binding cell elongation regulator Jag/EloR [Candidatus Rifleibacterium sp.]HPT47900.1 RNA-binding cell elongation regulator Jag/EloR [Candidatus Rifleibacterium sp.]